jgi:hypothetical protein
LKGHLPLAHLWVHPQEFSQREGVSSLKIIPFFFGATHIWLLVYVEVQCTGTLPLIQNTYSLHFSQNPLDSETD